MRGLSPVHDGGMQPDAPAQPDGTEPDPDPDAEAGHTGTASSSRARDHMANERTYLAWLRTAANVMIVGLAIARFGAGEQVTTSAVAAGAVLLAAGGLGVGYAVRRYRAIARELEHGRYVTGASTRGPVVAAVVLVVAVVGSLVVLLTGDVGWQ